MSDRLQRRHPSRLALRSQLISRIAGDINLHTCDILQLRMAGVKLPRLPPSAVWHNQLNRSPVVHRQGMNQIQSVPRRIEHECSILRRHNILEIESLAVRAAHPHLAVDQRTNCKQSGIAAARQLSMMNHQTNLGGEFNSRQRRAHTRLARRRANRAGIFDSAEASQFDFLFVNQAFSRSREAYRLRLALATRDATGIRRHR